MFILNGKPLSPDVAFTTGGIQYPANWLRLATPEEREAIGITEQADPPVWDQRFCVGLLGRWPADLEGSHPTGGAVGSADPHYRWYVAGSPPIGSSSAKLDNGKVVLIQLLKQLREDIRLATGQKNAAIEATADTAELAAYITGTEYPVWPSDSPAPVEPAPVDGLEPTGDQPEE
jgi:hypothetical protein